MAYGCGQCLPCRINKKRTWLHRILLETSNHENSTFVTLTYRESTLPPDSKLDKRHPILFIKRLRKRLGQEKIRYFLVGEYGEEKNRPHYHFMLFGYPRCIDGITPQYIFKKDGTQSNHCPNCDLIRDIWGLGHTYLGEVNNQTAEYISGYVTKKMTNGKNEEVKFKLNGKTPEFATMSRRPGIGANAIDLLADILTTDHGCDSLLSNLDVPQSLKHGKKTLPLGRYIRSKLRERLGHEDVFKEENKKNHFHEMSQLFKETTKEAGNTNKTFKQILIDTNSQTVKNIEARHKIWAKKGSL